jgi:hypothetical protein
MVTDGREAVDLMLDSNVFAKGIDLCITQSGRDLAWLGPADVTLDFDVVQKLEALVRDSKPSPKSQEVAKWLSTPNVAFELGFYTGASQLGPLQEYRLGLTNAAQLLAEDLRSIDLLAWTANDAVTVIEAKLTDSDTPNSCLIVGNFLAPSLHLPYPQTQYFTSVRDDLYALISALDHAGAIVQNALFLCRSEARYVNAVIAILLRIAFSGVDLFCSVRWVRRRWFLFHGARPPRPPMQAILSLFPGACSGPRLAY